MSQESQRRRKIIDSRTVLGFAVPFACLAASIYDGQTWALAVGLLYVIAYAAVPRARVA